MCIDGLDAEGPHEGALSEVQAGRHYRRSGLIALQHSLQQKPFTEAQQTDYMTVSRQPSHESATVMTFSIKED